jgi:hypothetical protein
MSDVQDTSDRYKKYADGENFDQTEKGRAGQDNKIDVLVREEICEVRARLPL